MPNWLKPAINLDILRPQGESRKLHIALFGWLLSSGRYTIIIVEIIVLVSFVLRFKLDADLAKTKEGIDEQIPLIESSRNEEQFIRKTQYQLTAIKDTKNNSANFSNLMQEIASQTPIGVTVQNINMEKETSRINLRISGVAADNNNLTSYITGLRAGGFSDATIADVELDRDRLNFTINATANLTSGSGRAL